MNRKKSTGQWIKKPLYSPIMSESFKKFTDGYEQFRHKYALGDDATMHQLAYHGQKPETMMVSCCDSRVDPALILQCKPGDLFIARNVANIVPPYEGEIKRPRGTSAALEFGICYLAVKDLVILGHSQCGGIQAYFDGSNLGDQDDFLSSWVSILKADRSKATTVDDLAKLALLHSYENCLTFPWIKERVEQGTLEIHLWFFDIKTGQISDYSFEDETFHSLGR